VLLDEQDPHAAFSGRLPDGVEEPFHHQRGQAEGELIGEKDLRAPAQRAAHGQHLSDTLAQISRDHLGVGPDLVGGTGTQDGPEVEDHDAVADPHDEAHVVLHEHHPDAPSVGELADERR